MARQHSRASVADLAPPAAAPGRLWIVSPLWDSLLFIGSPLLVIAVFTPLRAVLSSHQISLFLLAFFTFGHHLPGFLRAYGDHELFARYRWRFLLAPPLIFGVTLLFDARGLHGLLFLVFAWDIWHVLMQHYGFMRIYDAKSGRISALTARLDWVVSIAWYVTFVVMSPQYRHDFLFRAYSSGAPIVPAELLALAEKTLLVTSFLLTVVYAGYNLWQWKRGFSLNLRKAALLAAFLFASWYLYVWVEDFIFGFAVWSAFHCIQYFGIVWAFNESRVRNSNQVAGLLQPLFRPGFVPVLAYVALILAYGAVNYGTGFLSDFAVRNLMMSFIITSGALHYYYDGFIWKVREKDTRRHLRIQPDAPLQAAKPDQPPLRFAAGWAHVSLLALILGSLAVLESLNSIDEVTLRQALVAASPQAAVGYRNLGGALRDRGLLESAAGAYERAAKESPQDAALRHQLGLTLAELGRLEEALRAFESALRLDPGLSEAHYNTGVLLARMGKANAALEHLRKAFPSGDAAALDAVAKRPGGAEALNNLGLGTLQSGDRQMAGEMFQRALSADPGNVEARVNWANLLLIDGKLAEARSHFEEALRLAPQHPTARNNLGLSLLRLGKDSEARPHLEFALRHGDPEVSSSARKALAGIDGDSLR